MHAHIIHKVEDTVISDCTAIECYAVLVLVDSSSDHIPSSSSYVLTEEKRSQDTKYAIQSTNRKHSNIR